MSHQQFNFQAQPTSIPVHIQPFSQAIVSSQPVLYPPGTDPYTCSGLYHSTHVGFDDTAGGFYANPNVHSQSWITKEATAVRYDTSSSVPSTSSNLGNSRCADQPMLDYSTGNVTGQGKMKNTGVAFPTGVGSTAAPQMIGALDAVTSQSLEVKRRKLLDGGASADLVRLCTICNVACNSQEAFNAHLVGKRHLTQSAVQSKLMAAGGAGPVFASIRANTWTNGVKKAKTVQSTWCQVCNIKCTSNDVYTKHLLGKKHQNNLENFAKPNTVSSVATDNSGSVQRIKVSSQPSEADLEAKRRKVLESGAATSAVRVCTVCNVVCNSQKVFDTHISGQKHQAMVKAQAF